MDCYTNGCPDQHLPPDANCVDVDDVITLTYDGISKHLSIGVNDVRVVCSLYVCARVHAYMCVYTCVCAWAYIHARVCVCVNICVCACMHVCVQTRTYICAHMCMYTHYTDVCNTLMKW